MAPGIHVLTFVAYVTAENVDSAQSAPLTLLVSSPGDAAIEPDSSAELAPGQSRGDAIDCAVARLGDGAALAALPTGELRLVDTRRSQSMALEWAMPAGAWQLRAVTTHPDFARTRRVYVLLSERSDDVRLAVVRYRELGGILGERAVVAMLSLRAEAQRPRLRFGPDGELYVALLGDAPPRNPASSSDAAPFMIRLNGDRPDPAGRPGERSDPGSAAVNPTAFDWDAVNGDLWIVEQPEDAHARVRTAQRPDAVIEFSPAEAAAVGVGVVRTPDAPSIARVWAFMSDGLARELDGPAESPPLREFVEGERGRIHDAVLTPDGRVLSCGSRSSEPGTYFVQSANWR